MEYLEGLEPWPSLMICLLTFSSRTSIWESTLGGTLPSWEGGSPSTKALPSVTISFSCSEAQMMQQEKKNTLVNNQFFNKQGKVSYFIFREWMNELNKHQFIPWDWLCCSRGYSSIVSNLFNLEELNEKGLVLEWLAKSIRTQTTFLSVEFDYTRSLCN